MVLLILNVCFQEEMKKLGYEEGKEDELTGRKRLLMQEIGTLKEKVDALEARSVLFISTSS